MKSSDPKRKQLCAEHPTIAWIRRHIAALISPLANLQTSASRAVPVRVISATEFERPRDARRGGRAIL